MSVFTIWNMPIDCLTGDDEIKKRKSQILSQRRYFNLFDLHEGVFRRHTEQVKKMLSRASECQPRRQTRGKSTRKSRSRHFG